jgi:hypothetical protein
MDASASIQPPPPFETVKAALMAGTTQDEIDAWYALGNERIRNMSSKGGGGSATMTLTNLLLKETGFFYQLVSFTSVPQTSRLLITCTELYTAEEVVLQKLPKVCDMSSSRFDNDNEFKLYGAIVVKAPNSRWLEWLDTSGVEELKLPRHPGGRHYTGVTDKEMLIMFGGERFSELRTLNLCNCSNITDASVMEVARRCSNLQTLDLDCCSNITDASVSEVARRCSNLQTLNLDRCSNITDASVSEVARRCSNLQTLNLPGKFYDYGISRWSVSPNITDASVLEVARGCSNLQSLNLTNCQGNITGASVLEVVRRCSNLQTLNLGGCSNITDASLLEIARGCTNLKTFSAPSCITDDSLREVARRCSNLRTLNLGGCRNITDASVLEIARRCLHLQKLDLNHCSNITDASLLEVARGCSNLQWLCLMNCRNITSAAKNAVKDLFSDQNSWVRQSPPKPSVFY